MVKRSRRQRGEGGLYQRADGMWIGVVDLGYGPDGKRRRKPVSSKSYAVAQKKLTALKREVAQHGGNLPTANWTVEKWLNHWLDTIASERVRPRTLTGYRSYVDTWLIPHLGRRRLDQLRPEHIRALYATMRDAGKSDATRRQCHAILSRALTIAVREGKATSNPAALIDAPSTHVEHRKPLTLVEARQVIDALDGDPLASRWLCALLEGLRQGEALGLRWEDVDLDAGRVHIRRAIQRQKGKGLVVVEPKSRTSKRPIPLVPPVAYALESHRRATGGEGYVWGGEHPTDPRRDWQAWKDLLERAGVSDHALHAARNTTASLLSLARVPDKIISEILGHANVQITREAYIHGDDVQHRDAMAALGRLIQPED